MPSGTDIAKAYVQIIPSAEGIKGKLTEAMGGEADAAGKSAGSKFSATFGKFAKAGAVAAAAALGAVIKKSVESYAEYEQLVGGVEKIFDEANQAQILQDANEAFKDLNMSANEYLAAINQTGAAFAQTMGDQKGYDAARKGMKAIADYASGTGRNLEELNDKFALITRSTSSYQSIADQFSGILPATSKDFLEQAQAAGILSDSYKSLTEVPIAEYQQAVTEMLEKGVDSMGLLGNTAAESLGTISGSLAMTKSAWSNFVTGLADENANIEELTQNLVTSITAVAQNIIPVIGQIISTLGKMLGDAIVRGADKLLTGGATVAVNFIEGIASKISGIIAKGREAVAAFASGVRNAVGSVISAGLSLVQGIWQGISNGLGWIKGKIQGWVGNVVAFIKNLFGIHSPSAVMRDEVGRFMALGIGEGFTAAMGGVERDMLDSMPDISGFQTTYSLTANSAESNTGGIGGELAALREEIRNMKIYLDTGVLVGAVDSGLGGNYIAARRRVLA